MYGMDPVAAMEYHSADSSMVYYRAPYIADSSGGDTTLDSCGVESTENCCGSSSTCIVETTV